jgi:hypothetical protein
LHESAKNKNAFFCSDRLQRRRTLLANPANAQSDRKRAQAAGDDAIKWQCRSQSCGFGIYNYNASFL